MIKNFFIIFSFFMLSVPIALAQPAGAGDRQSNALLESGLLGLKESYNQLVQHNQFLKSRIKTYRQNTQALSNELKRLRSQETDLLAQKADTAQARVRSDEDEAIVVQGEIGRLQQRLDSLTDKALSNTFRHKKDRLAASLQESSHDLQKAESELRIIQNQSAGSSQTITQLQQKLFTLKDRLWKSQMGSSSVTYGSAQRARAEAYLAQLTNEAALMRLYRQQLEADLSYAGNDGPAPLITREEDQLRRKWTVLNEENIHLKKSLATSSPIFTSQEPY